MMSDFEKARAAYVPRMPLALAELRRAHWVLQSEHQTSPNLHDTATLQHLFPNTWGQALLSLTHTTSERERLGKLNVGVVLSGGPAPGGHNVLLGLWEGLSMLASEVQLWGFLGGPGGILERHTRLLSGLELATHRNAGGFDSIGTGRTKIESPEQLARCAATLHDMALDALVIVGGDDSNTNAAVLSEYLRKIGSKVAIIGVPKTIDGDLRNRFVEMSFGFDTAVRVYAEMIANVAKDALSTRKYYHFIKLMGRSASHITLEAALETQPNLALISEEIAARGMTLAALVDELASLVCRRAEIGKHYGMILVPEGVIEFLPEFKALIAELNSVLGEHQAHVATLSGYTAQSEYVHRKLSKDATYTLSTLPIDIQRQMLMDRDPHGNIIVSRIDTEKLLVEMLQSRLAELKSEGRYHGHFQYQTHFLGYEGRCAAPTNFDADYAYCLGRTAAALAANRANGYLAAIQGLSGERRLWQAKGVPLAALMTLEKRHGRDKPVIAKALVDTKSKAFASFALRRESWVLEDHYRFAGPVQYFGPEELTDRIPALIALEHQGTTSEVR